MTQTWYLWAPTLPVLLSHSEIEKEKEKEEKCKLALAHEERVRRTTLKMIA